jgi:NAD(P)H-dependent flavin oxidoreductase YrpB (nitropropane dioxygenase family)
MIETNITQMLGIKHPIIAAPMGPFYTHKLCAAVSEAGGLGVLSHITLHGTVSLEEMKKGMEYVVEHTDKPFGFNIRTASLQPDAIKICRQIPRFIMRNPRIKEQCRYLITSAGSPKMAQNKYFEALKESRLGLKHFHVIPSLEFAEKVMRSGVDGLVATGHEGGGHQSYETTSTLILLQQIRTRLPDVPLIACGGYATGEGLASALAMGAGAIAMGSRFIATKECDFNDDYKNVVANASVSDTKLVTGVFGPARVWKNKYALSHDAVVSKEEKRAEETSMAVINEGLESLEKAYEGNMEDGSILLGQSSGLIFSLKNVSEIIDKTVQKAEICLKKAYDTVLNYQITTPKVIAH